MFLLWLGTFLLAASPQLRRLLHADAQNANHHCLVTQIKQHSVLSVVSTVSAPVVAPPVFALRPWPAFQFISATDLRLSPSRAPPFLFSSSTVAGCGGAKTPCPRLS